jgi:hypothetical protein
LSLFGEHLWLVLCAIEGRVYLMYSLIEYATLGSVLARLILCYPFDRKENPSNSSIVATIILFLKDEYKNTKQSQLNYFFACAKLSKCEKM